MATTPREPRFRILVAVVLTAAIGGMFLAGEFRNQAGAPLSSAPADRRFAQQAPPVATAPSADEILTYNGRDPFTRDQEEKKASQKPPAADPLTPVAQSVTPLAPSAGVTVSVGNAASPLSGVGSTRTSPVTRRGDDDGDDLDVVVKVPRVDEPTVVDPLVDPVPVYPVPVADGGGAGSPEPDGTLDRGGKWGKTKNKPAKAKHGEAPPYPAYQPTKEKSWKDRGHKGQSSRPGRRVGQTRSGWRGKGHAWGWKAARCDKSHPSSNGHCRR